MKLLIQTTAILAPTAGAALADGHSVVRLGTEGAYAPWNFLDDNGEVAGFERELGDELCVRAELTCEWVTNEWDSIIPNLVSGNYDAIIAGMSITAERDEVIDFTMGYTPPDPSGYLAASADADIMGGVVAAQVNTIQAAFLAEAGVTVLEFPESVWDAMYEASKGVYAEFMSDDLFKKINDDYFASMDDSSGWITNSESAYRIQRSRVRA